MVARGCARADTSVTVNLGIDRIERARQVDDLNSPTGEEKSRVTGEDDPWGELVDRIGPAPNQDERLGESASGENREPAEASASQRTSGRRRPRQGHLSRRARLAVLAMLSILFGAFAGVLLSAVIAGDAATRSRPSSLGSGSDRSAVRPNGVRGIGGVGSSRDVHVRRRSGPSRARQGRAVTETGAGALKRRTAPGRRDQPRRADDAAPSASVPSEAPPPTYTAPKPMPPTEPAPQPSAAERDRGGLLDGSRSSAEFGL